MIANPVFLNSGIESYDISLMSVTVISFWLRCRLVLSVLSSKAYRSIHKGRENQYSLNRAT